MPSRHPVLEQRYGHVGHILPGNAHGGEHGPGLLGLIDVVDGDDAHALAPPALGRPQRPHGADVVGAQHGGDLVPRQQLFHGLKSGLLALIRGKDHPVIQGQIVADQALAIAHVPALIGAVPNVGDLPVAQLQQVLHRHGRRLGPVAHHLVHLEVQGIAPQPHRVAGNGPNGPQQFLRAAAQDEEPLCALGGQIVPLPQDAGKLHFLAVELLLQRPVQFQKKGVRVQGVDAGQHHRHPGPGLELAAPGSKLPRRLVGLIAQLLGGAENSVPHRLGGAVLARQYPGYRRGRNAHHLGNALEGHALPSLLANVFVIKP